MRKHFSLFGLSAFVGIATVGWITEPVPAELDLVGAWTVISEDESHLGALIFTEGSYSFMLANGNEPRALFADPEPTAEEVIAAYNSITANSGRYQLEGNEINFEAYMAKNPNYMAAWPDNDAQGTLTMDGDVLVANVMGRTLRLQRVEGGDDGG